MTTGEATLKNEIQIRVRSGLSAIPYSAVISREDKSLVDPPIDPPIDAPTDSQQTHP